jgi:hypothetical protein
MPQSDSEHCQCEFVQYINLSLGGNDHVGVEHTVHHLYIHPDIRSWEAADGLPLRLSSAQPEIEFAR